MGGTRGRTRVAERPCTPDRSDRARLLLLTVLRARRRVLGIFADVAPKVRLPTLGPLWPISRVEGLEGDRLERGREI